MGRHPKPTAMLKLEGAWRADRHGIEEPKPNGAPKKPRGLPKEAAKLWDRVVPQLTKLGLATELDATALEEMSRWYGVYVDMRNRLAKDPQPGTLYATQSAFKAFDSLAARFGLTPVDRAKLRGVVDHPKPSPVVRRVRG